ncbi:MAG: DUF4349 domain-containing protein [Brevundimonas sp.]|uniref:DUF4349 domain-containing protein n=1 Tax=Brevundimonas sp. TaxID=1871086 RepID=UPI00391B56F5
MTPTRMLLVWCAGTALLLAACEGEGDSGAPEIATEGFAPATAPQADASRPMADGGEGEQAPAPATRMAYAYNYGLSLPAARVSTLMQQHEAACVGAGPGQCELLRVDTRQIGRDHVQGSVEFRGSPAFVARFRSGLASEVEAQNGRIEHQGVEGEDLTRSMIDTEARITALTALRDRLQQLLATRQGSLQELLEVQRELARVQGELDAARSSMQTLGTRVATSRVNISYTSAGQIAPDSALRPLQRALEQSLQTFTSSLGLLILVLAAILPLALIVVPIAWLLIHRRKRARPRRTTYVTPETTVRPDPQSGEPDRES